MLTRAINSVAAQTLEAASLSIAIDEEKIGAWHIWQRALDGASTRWVAFLDDDDEMLPHHLETLCAAQEATGAHVIVSWYEVMYGVDPAPLGRFCQFPDQPALATTPFHSFGITCLVDRQFVVEHDVRFRERTLGVTPAEDAMFWREMADKGARFHQLPDITWRYYHGGHNTSGLPLW